MFVCRKPTAPTKCRSAPSRDKDDPMITNQIAPISKLRHKDLLGIFQIDAR